MKKFKVKLFYSYCHKDQPDRNDMEEALGSLKKDGLIDEWHDEKLVPGQPFDTSIVQKLEEANIIVFLVSTDFLKSDSCVKEWSMAREKAGTKGQSLIPVILKECDWKQFKDMKDYFALPKNGRPISFWDNKDEAWRNVYEGIKNTVENLHRTFLLKDEFEKQISATEFVSQEKDNIQLEDLFVFPHLSIVSEDSPEHSITRCEDILKTRNVIVRGDEQSGKTTLCRKMVLHLAENNKPVVFIDLNEIAHKKPNVEIFRMCYTKQFSGDYSLWNAQEDKTVILDNLSGSTNSLRHVEFAQENFSNVLVTTSNDFFHAYFKDDERLATFTEIKINPLKNAQQEELIRKWTSLKGKNNRTWHEIEDGKIDQIETSINSIIINNKILPRYPFFVLSILQTHEAFMPSNLHITAYGHCYYALIIAHLVRSDINKEDIDSGLNFLSALAFFIHKNGSEYSLNKEKYEKFKAQYEEEYIVKKSTINRLYHGILKKTANETYLFAWPYSYYFFLGKYLAKNFSDNKTLIEKMVEKVYIRDNSLSIIFTIHHAQESEIIDDILTHTICALDSMQPAKLDFEETRVFNNLLEKIPRRILSKKSPEEERKLARAKRDRDQDDIVTHEQESSDETINEVYKLLKNMEILSQIVKNKYGSLPQNKLSEIVEIIADGGLRLIKLLLFNEDELNDFVRFLAKKLENSKYASHDKTSESKQLNFLDKQTRFLIFAWTLITIEKVVDSINKKEIKRIIEDIHKDKDTPAYDLIYYFYSLETADAFSERHKQLLKDMLSKYNEKDNGILHRILSLKTQFYFNTHRTKEPLKQSVCHMLNKSI